MFFILNKEKIYSYVVAVCMVAVLFFVSEIYIKDETIEVSSNVINETNDINTKFNFLCRQNQ